MKRTVRLIIAVMILFFSGCGSRTQPVYTGEYLKSAQKLEKALAENPEAGNRDAVEARIQKLYELHEKMLEAERVRIEQERIR